MKSRLFFITYLAANLGLVLYGALALLVPSNLLDSFSVHVYQLPSDATGATAYLAALFRLLGFFNMLTGILGMLLLRRLMLSWKPWISRLLTGSTALAYLGPIIFDNTVGNIGFFEMMEHILFALVVFFGVVLWREPR